MITKDKIQVSQPVEPKHHLTFKVRLHIFSAGRTALSCQPEL